MVVTGTTKTKKSNSKVQRAGTTEIADDKSDQSGVVKDYKEK